jgi:putative cardiolipin synthase
MTRADIPVAIANLALAALLAGCASLPALEGRAPSYALADTSETRLAHAVAADVAAHPAQTGIHPLPAGSDAFATRVLLAAAAERSIDAQYYIWHGDQVGYLLFEALWQAAERGVRVRLLLDDLNTGGLDATLAALAAQPNIEVRLYNPVVQREARLLNFVTDFTRVNRRMHNKSFTVDNQVTVVGGRNVGNEYFGAGSGVLFADLDVVATGAAVRDVSKEFDLYWNSPSAYPAPLFVGRAGRDSAPALEARFATTRADPESIAYLDAVRATPVVREILERRLILEWANVEVVHDDPAKTLDATGSPDVLLFPELVAAMGRPQQSLDLVSPYFVPGDGGTAAIMAMAQRGVRVRVLTNSLAATDESAVHAGYGKRRRDLLAAGVQLYEPADGEGRANRGLWRAVASHRRSTPRRSPSTAAASSSAHSTRPALGTSQHRDGLRDRQSGAQQALATARRRRASRRLKFCFVPDGRALEYRAHAEGEARYDVEPATSWALRSGELLDPADRVAAVTGASTVRHATLLLLFLSLLAVSVRRRRFPRRARGDRRADDSAQASGCESIARHLVPGSRRRSHSDQARLPEERGVQNAEQFIERAASRSSVSGRAYLIKCGDQPPTETGTWLALQLQAMRASAPVANPP